MGEVADLMLLGVLCIRCGSFVTDAPPGHPQFCEDCKHDDEHGFDDDDFI